MKILVLDTSAQKQPPVWERAGENIYYSDNPYERESDKPYYSLSFSYTFQSGKRVIYFAHSIPYTYTMLNDYLNIHAKKRFVLCHSLAGNKVEYIHIDESSKWHVVMPRVKQDITPKKITNKLLEGRESKIREKNISKTEVRDN